MERLKQIQHLDKAAMDAAGAQWNRIAKPLHSLGMLEEDIIQLAGMMKNPDVRLEKRAVVVMCGDNGVVAEGVTQSDSSVTGIVADAMARGDGNINSLAGAYRADVIPVDMGMLAEPDASQKSSGLEVSTTLGASKVYKIVDYKVAHGTMNIARGAAMTKEQVRLAVSRGIDMAGLCKEAGYDILVTGEMGIGNTTTSSAIAAVLLDTPVQAVTGRGAGLDSQGLHRKLQVIQQAIAVNGPDKDKPLELLRMLGGYDIAGMVGLYLGGAVYGIPVVIDGVISAVAAAIAIGICPESKDFMLCAHVSKEPAGQMMLDYLGLKPVIQGELCLGEGTGGIMLLPLLDGALSLYHSVHSFDGLNIARYEELS